MSISPLAHTFGQAVGSSFDFTFTYPTSNADLVVGDITFPSWLDASVGTTTAGLRDKVTIVTFTTNAANTAITERATETISFTSNGVTVPTPSVVTQAGDTQNAPSASLSANNTTLTTNQEVLLTASGITDPAGGPIRYQWFRDQSEITGQSGLVPMTGTVTFEDTRSTQGSHTYRIRLTSEASGLSGFATPDNVQVIKY